jgi:hypothetical protein
MTEAMIPPVEETRDRVPSLGQIVTGAILMLIGFAWLAEAADWFDVPWRALLAGALIIVGAALMFGARRASHGGLIAFGVILAVLLSLSSAVAVLADIPLTGGIGEQRHRPTVELDDEYRWGIGQMTLDLRDLSAEEAGEAVAASVAIGELVVYLPTGVDVAIEARVGIGEVQIFDERSSGFDADLSVAAPEGALTLDLDVAIGKVEVRR